MNPGSIPGRVTTSPPSIRISLSILIDWRMLAAFVLRCMVFAGCAETPPYKYEYIPGRTATVSPMTAPPPLRPARQTAVLAAIAAGNEIAGSPYVYGGGHGEGRGGFDCSGATSYVLRAAGRLTGNDALGRVPALRGRTDRVAGSASTPATDTFSSWSRGLRFDTGWTGEENSGPRWTRRSRPAEGCVIRHPSGVVNGNRFLAFTG